MTHHITLTMTLRVWDAGAFRKAARDRAIKDGMPAATAAEYLNPETHDLGDCAVMLIDPGVSPPGCEIDQTDTESFDTDEEEE